MRSIGTIIIIVLFCFVPTFAMENVSSLALPKDYLSWPSIETICKINGHVVSLVIFGKLHPVEKRFETISIQTIGYGALTGFISSYNTIAILHLKDRLLVEVPIHEVDFYDAYIPTDNEWIKFDYNNIADTNAALSLLRNMVSRKLGVSLETLENDKSCEGKRETLRSFLDIAYDQL